MLQRTIPHGKMQILACVYFSIIVCGLTGAAEATGSVRAGRFAAVTDAVGSLVCAEDAPTTVTAGVRSQLVCSGECESNSECVAFNYRQSLKHCEQFEYPPSNVLIMADCTFYQKRQPDCPPGFLRNSTSAPNKCYMLVMSSANWNNAGVSCKALYSGAHLATPRTYYQQKALSSLIAENKGLFQAASCPCAPSTTFITLWLAGQRINPALSGSLPFVWRTLDPDSSSQIDSTMTFTNWYPGDPQNSAGAEYCIATWIVSGLSWIDFSCGTPACYICQLDL